MSGTSSAFTSAGGAIAAGTNTITNAFKQSISDAVLASVLEFVDKNPDAAAAIPGADKATLPDGIQKFVTKNLNKWRTSKTFDNKARVVAFVTALGGDKSLKNLEAVQNGLNKTVTATTTAATVTINPTASTAPTMPVIQKKPEAFY